MFGTETPPGGVEETRDQQLGELLVQQPLPMPVQPATTTSAAHVAMMRRQRAAAGAAASNMDSVTSVWNGAAAASHSHIEQLRAEQTQSLEQQHTAAGKSQGVELAPLTAGFKAGSPVASEKSKAAKAFEAPDLLVSTGAFPARPPATAVPSAVYEDPRGAALLHSTPAPATVQQASADAPLGGARGGALGGFEAELGHGPRAAPVQWQRRLLQGDLRGARIPRIIHQIYFPGQAAYLAATRKPNAFLQVVLAAFVLNTCCTVHLCGMCAPALPMDGWVRVHECIMNASQWTDCIMLDYPVISTMSLLCRLRSSQCPQSSSSSSSSSSSYSLLASVPSTHTDGMARLMPNPPPALELHLLEHFHGRGAHPAPHALLSASLSVLSNRHVPSRRLSLHRPQ